MDLNQEQLEAVNAGEGVYQVLAGPGSGKTKTLVARYKRLTDLGHSVLCLTFTRAAAEEMKSRAGGGNFRTVHSAACSVLVDSGQTPAFESINYQALMDSLVRRATPFAKSNHDYLMVDEAQDLSEDDWTFVSRLSDNVFAVGDAMQAIYAWRTAKPDLFFNMPARFPGCKTLLLGRNYRSTQNIVEFCKKIAPLRGELLEKMCSESEQGDPVRFFNYGNNVEEAEAVLNQSVLLPGNTAVLARTNQQLEVFRKLGAHQENLEFLTIHGAKGKEFDNVFVLGVQDGLLPYKDGDLDEESRILFVAASRAKKRLFLTSYGSTSKLLIRG